MSLTWLEASADSIFPPIEYAYEDGLLAAGGDLSASRLIDAYRRGIFPWFNRNDPILWWSPDPRMVLFTNDVKISRSLKKAIRTTDITVTMDRAFSDVIACCAAPRQNQSNDTGDTTWIHSDMIDAYNQLHQQGIAHSVECWHEGQLVGGLYGIALGQVFFGESMFSSMADGSKIALVTLCQQLQRWGFLIIDCQVYSEHLASMGAQEIARKDFIGYLDKYCATTMPDGHWQLDLDLPIKS
ncbi:MAG: leucyl/phenylalanyl-tRNA--protein transferase [Gammaproteobacteria bacterium]|nr:leucyl/phenylalanyl-tRNA--protein transferase [Gammaproteobacteria bacterium]MDH5591583.1 leucyl/phenylalanyl-tRNA--protein transferase [Gammaproteobacteria bacterium]